MRTGGFQTQNPLLPNLFFESSSGLIFPRLDILTASSSTRTGLEDLALPMGAVWPFFNVAWLGFPGSSPPARRKRRTLSDGTGVIRWDERVVSNLSYGLLSSK